MSSDVIANKRVAGVCSQAPPGAWVMRKVSEVNAPNGKLIPQWAMLKGCSRMVAICVVASIKKKAPTPHTIQTKVNGASSCSKLNPMSDGGTTVMNHVGAMRAGMGPACAMRTNIKVCNTIHKNTPTPN